jgi:hypothetical protein
MIETVSAGNLIITGIPRSGTSYACALLNNVENTVIVNEPEEIFKVLRNGSDDDLKSYYDHIRYRIRNGIPIQNKILDGKHIEDTNEGDVRSYYIPEVQDADFVFGTKNTLVYLASLHKIDRQLPGVRVLLLVRHPFECISSWKKVRFPHIKNASPLFLRDYMEAADAQEITRICSYPELATRYALLWNFLAVRIMHYQDRIFMCKYEDFVARPGHYLSGLYRSMGKRMRLKSPVAASQARRHGEGLSELELDRVRTYCSDSADRFGYSLQGSI